MYAFFLAFECAGWLGRGLLATGPRRLSNQERVHKEILEVSPQVGSRMFPKLGLLGSLRRGKPQPDPERGVKSSELKKIPILPRDKSEQATGDSSVRDGDGGPAPTTSEQARGTADIICPDAGVDEGEGAASDSDDEEYTAPLDEVLASDDSDDPMDDGGSEGEGASGDYERRWRDATCRYILPESYSGGSSYSIRNWAEAMETLMSLWVII
ncbi:hypothetical protein MRB53_023602 [Persea americana]|uniref:Uncharacterized protein n=1 Tax=Persea americana TaxID=3435 RepID=A0ACC2L9X0_PERAE|nr:hypothetical protein MRB53_023602 [Persea americana]